MSRQVSGRVLSVTTTTAVQAHRGSPDQATGIRENTLGAFARARSLGADGVELDVRRTADGGLAVHHDPVIEGRGPVHRLVTADLPAYVPLLADALATCAGMTVNIEVKNLPTEEAFDPSERCARDVVEAVAATTAPVAVVVSSFWSGALAAVRDSGSGLPTGLLVLPSYDVATAVAGAVDLGCAAVHLPVALVTRAGVDRAHAAGLAVAAWTVVDGDGLATVLAAGADTVITDDVALARRGIDGSGVPPGGAS
jgi:glycerophosphoryl diester phosphodiesterase